MGSKKIAILADFFNEIGGTEHFLSRAISLLNESNYEIKLFIGEKPKRDYWVSRIPKNIEVYTSNVYRTLSPGREAENKFVQNVVIPNLRRWKPDYTFGVPHGKMMIEYLCQQETFDETLVSYEYSSPCASNVDWYQQDLKMHINKIDLVLATCDDSARNVSSFLGYDGPTKVVRHLLPSCDSSLYSRPENQHVGCIARLSKEKGVSVLVDAFSLVVKEIPSAHLTIYGEGSEGIALDKQIKDCALDSYIDISQPFEPGSGIVDVVNRHCMFVFPSFFESIPTALLEVTNFGAPVLATNVGGIPETMNVSPEALFSPGDHMMLGELMIEYLSDFGKLNELGKKQHSRIVDLYHPEEIVKSFLEVFS